jgi:branched-chain amino acid transport system substrate-binding protein
MSIRSRLGQARSVRAGVAFAALVGLVAAGGAVGAARVRHAAAPPVIIGLSSSLTGDFSADGQANVQGYKLWQSYVNSHGGLLGRQVELKILNDNSDPAQVTTDYEALVNQYHANLLFGPFSTLLNPPAAAIARRYGYMFLEGNGGGPSVFAQHNAYLFDVSSPTQSQLVDFAKWLTSLPKSERPKTAAYATYQDPFTQPQIDLARQMLQAAGIKTVSYQVFPDETTDFTPIALKIVHSNAQVVVVGSLINLAAAMVNTFRQQHYNPEVLSFTAGPDQGSQWLKVVGGAKMTEGIMVEISWTPFLNTYQNKLMVDMYLKKYGGTPEAMSSDIAETFSVGQVLQQAVAATHSLNNATLRAYIENSSHTFQTVQGPVHYVKGGWGESDAPSYIGQWQNGKLVFVYPPFIANGLKVEFPKPNWP